MDEMNTPTSSQDVDALLADIRQLLQEDGPTAQAEDRPVSPVMPDAAVSAPPTTAADIKIDYEKFYGDMPSVPIPAPQAQKGANTIVYQRPSAYEQSKSAYQTTVRSRLAIQKELERQAREQERQRREQAELAAMAQMEARRPDRKKKKPSPSDDSYSQWLYEQGSDPETEKQRKAADAAAEQQTPPPKKKKHGFVTFLLILLLIPVALAALIHFVLAAQPTAEVGLGPRKENVSTILIAGTDEGGYRTDTMMLVRFDRKNTAVSLVSVPRDTLVYCEYSVPKLNSAYGWGGGGEGGMLELMDRMEEILGFRPDGYAVVGLDTFRQLVDLMGGVQFNVPVEMHYSDPTQDLFIDLAAGDQLLDGEKSMQLVRFRSGYANADLGRIDVQRQFVSSALDQWVSLKNIPNLPAALKLLIDGSETDLSLRELAWLTESALFCRGDVSMQTLPGAAAYLSGGSYYVLDKSGVAVTVNQLLNPYQKEVTADDLWIRLG